MRKQIILIHFLISYLKFPIPYSHHSFGFAFPATIFRKNKHKNEMRKQVIEPTFSFLILNFLFLILNDWIHPGRSAHFEVCDLCRLYRNRTPSDRLPEFHLANYHAPG